VHELSVYQLNRAIYNWIRAGEVNSGEQADGRVGFDVSSYELSPEERKAFDGKDIGALYQLGLHPVLVNRFARAAGYARNDYRRILESYAKPEERIGRWQK
jgi:hypothetical protein